MEDQALTSRPPTEKRGSPKRKIAAEAGTSHRDIASSTGESYGGAQPSATIIPFPQHRVRPAVDLPAEPWEVGLLFACSHPERLSGRDLEFVASLARLYAAGRLHALSPKQEDWLMDVCDRLMDGGGHA